LSDVESVRYVATFIEALSTAHMDRAKLDALRNDDFGGRMAQRRVMAGELDVAARTLQPFRSSKNESISKSAEAGGQALAVYKVIFDKHRGIYEQMVRIFTVPHELSESERNTIAEMRITASEVAANFRQASELLKTVATLAFSSTIISAPGDETHIALDLSTNEKAEFMAILRRDFGDLGQESSLAGAEMAAFVLIVAFEPRWRLAR
jgi:hypothetical protein